MVPLAGCGESRPAAENRAPYFANRDGVAAWLAGENIPHCSPEILPSELYAEASHPLTAGYELMAKRTVADAAFRRWLGKP